MSFYTDSVQSTIKGFYAELEALANNGELSETGKQRRRADIQARIMQEREKALVYMRVEWKEIQADHSKIGEDENAARDQAAKGWDFQRLTYEATRAEQAIRNLAYTANPDLKDTGELIEDLYNQAASSGDKTRWRAWAEAGPALLPRAGEQEAGLKLNRLAARMRQDGERLTTTPELEAIVARGTDLTRRAMEADKAGEKAKIFYDRPPYNPKPPIYSEFDTMREGIRLVSRVNPGDPDRYLLTSLEIDE